MASLLPEIIDVSSGSVDPLLSRAIQTARKLGYGDGQRLSRHEVRTLCDKTAELADLSSVEVNTLYERADNNRVGRVSIQQFLNQYRHQKRLSAEVHFITDSYVSTLNFFESLDPAHTGKIDSQDLLEFWNKSGIRIDEGIAVLQQCGQPVSGMVNAIYLSTHLERELSMTTADAPVAVKTAIIALHCCIDHLRCNLKEFEERAEHSHKQLQLANHRRTMLIEELEHNQMAIDQSYEERMREMDEKYRSKINQLEEKLLTEKRDLQNDLEQVEDELSRVRQSETSTRNKVALLERQCVRLNEEARETAENIAQLEQLNRQLRAELNKAVQTRPSSLDSESIQLKQKVDLLVNHNKRLREKIQELEKETSKRKRRDDIVKAIGSGWSSSFKNQVSTIHKRRLNRGETLSEMDSEPESIFFRVRRRRLLKRRDRRQRYNQLQLRISQSTPISHPPISSESESTSSSAKYRLSSSSIFSKAGNRFHARSSHTASPMQASKPPAGFSVFITHAVEEEKKRWQEEMKKEIGRLKSENGRTVENALKDQESRHNNELEKERRLFDTRLMEERNTMERGFAEEKMKLMNRLQEDFDQELKRLASNQRMEKTSATIEHYKRQIKMLESSLEGQRNGYEKKLADMKERHNNVVKQMRDSTTIDRSSNSGSFLSLLEKYRRSDTSTGFSSTPSSSLAVEKRPALPTSSYHNQMPFQRSTSSLASRCDRCEQIDCRLRELYSILCGDETSAESGIEDLGSSTGSHTDDKLVLKKELRKWKGRTEMAKERLTELRILINSSGGASGGRYKSTLTPTNEKAPLKWSEIARKVERLESEKVILESRLAESQMLMKNVVEDYKKLHSYLTTKRSPSSLSLPPPPLVPIPPTESSSHKELHSAR